MRPIKRIFIKLIEVAACLSCVIAKAITDQEAKRVYILNHKLSREWSLLNNVTWSLAGNSFANVTYGGYTLITSLMAVSRLIESRSPPTIIEKIFLTLGMLMFLIMGGLVLAAIDQVPHALIDNAIIMGLLSFLVAFIFLIDLSDPLPMRRISATQTSPMHDMADQANNSADPQMKNGVAYARNLADSQPQHIVNRPEKDYPRQPQLPADRRPKSSGKSVHPQQQRIAKQHLNVVLPAAAPEQHQQHIIVHSDSPQPRTQEPVFAQILTPEKVRPHKSKIPTKGAFIVEEIPKSRRYSSVSDDDTLSRISGQSYVKAADVDTLPKGSLCETNKECEEVDSPIIPGYVASTAKMWDRRSKPTQIPPLGSNTRV